MLTGVVLFELVRRQFRHDWNVIQQDIEREIKRREALL
jgi:branched-chain amino acid transport system permease protein